MSLALDTNVLVKLLVRDDEGQQCAAASSHLKATEKGMPTMVSHSVMLATEWVLCSRYMISQAEIHHAFIALLETPELDV